MKSLTLRVALALLATLVIAACDTSPTSPTASSSSCTTSSIQYSFSFDGVRGLFDSIEGTIEGIITLDFLASALDSGTESACEIEITSDPLSLTPREGSVVTSWTTQARNTFTVLNGVITAYQFGAAEGAVPNSGHFAMCLNSGGFIAVGGAYNCLADENYYGNSFVRVFNFDGIGGVEFNQIPVP